MRRWAKWSLVAAVVLVVLAFASPRSAEARSRWASAAVGYGGFGFFPGASARPPFPYSGTFIVNPAQNPVYYIGPRVGKRPLYSPNPFYYDLPYGGYYWRPY
jgi:hypothetical protein